MKITIPNPCEQSWNAMQPQASGRFCDACQKCVVDFTQMSDAQLLQYFAKPSEGVCGRFRQGQLNTVLLPQPTVAPRGRWATALLFVTSLGLGEKTIADKKNYSINPLKTVVWRAKTNPKTSDGNVLVLKGKVVDTKTKEILVGVIIRLDSTTIGTITDVNGLFELNIPDAYQNSDNHLIAEFSGYITKIFALSSHNTTTDLVLDLNPDPTTQVIIKRYAVPAIRSGGASDSILTGMVCIIKPPKPTFWQRTKNIFRKKRQ